MHVQVVFCQSKQIAFLLLSLNGAPLLIAPLSWPLPEIQHLLIKTEIAWSFWNEPGTGYHIAPQTHNKIKK